MQASLRIATKRFPFVPLCDPAFGPLCLHDGSAARSLHSVLMVAAEHKVRPDVI